MDFIDWCHKILQVIEAERFSLHLGEYELQELLFGEFARSSEFHGSDIRQGMFQALETLENTGLVTERDYQWKITPLGRKVLADPTNFWTEICEHELDEQEQIILNVVNQLSPQEETNPICVWLKEIGSDPILNAFNIETSEGTNEDIEELHKYVYELPESLKEIGFLKTDGRVGYYNDVRPTYPGLVWTTRRGLTIESKFIDNLLKEWETTNVEFKREIALDTKKQKAEFGKDVLGLATTKSSGRRYMIIGFDDKTRSYHSAPNPLVTQDRMEMILADLTDPVVEIRYSILDYRLGKIGKLEVFREPHKLPYRVAQDMIIDEKGAKGLEKNKIYVRHGSHTESPTEIELKMLVDEGNLARQRAVQ